MTVRQRIVRVIERWPAVGRWVRHKAAVACSLSVLVIGLIASIAALGVRGAWNPAWYTHPVVVGVILGVAIVLVFTTWRLLRQLRALQRRERADSLAVGRFVGHMNHDLRASLNAALDSVRALRTGRALSLKEQSLVNVLHDATRDSLRYLDNMVDWWVIEARPPTSTWVEFDLHALLNDVTARVRQATDAKGGNVMLRITPDVPFRLVGDPDLLRVTLLNLACAYGEHGRVWLDVTRKNESSRATTLRFAIIHAGAAANAPARALQSIVPQDAASAQRGAFLAALAERLVERMGGEIAIHRTDGRDTGVRVELAFGKQVTPSADRSLADGRAVILSNDAQLVTAFGTLLPCPLIRATSVEVLDGMLAQTSRLGNPFDLVLVDGSMLANADAKRVESDVCDRAWLTNISVVLVVDDAAVPNRSRELGYRAVLPRTPTREAVYAVLHAATAGRVSANPKVATVMPRHSNGDADIARPRILLADDIQTNLLVTGRMLEGAGYDVDAVSSGDEALSRLLAGGYRLAVLDMHMPGFDGTDVLRQYRTLRPRSPVPIIVLTANVSFVAQQTCAEAGADAYLAKPVTADKLLGEIKRLLTMHKVEIVPFGRSASDRSEEDQEVLDLNVLADLDRLCRDPRELAFWVQQYEAEGRKLLQQIGAASDSRNHQGYGDAVQALKSNAANIGARKLMVACQEVEALSFAEFLRDRNDRAKLLHQAFEESIVALQHISKLREGRESGS